MGLYTVAGLAQKIELPVPLIVDLIPASQTSNRPGIPLQKPFVWVQHETANTSPGTGAAWHARWLKQQAGIQVSFHFVVDDRVIYQLCPTTEVTWQAADGSGPGNMSGVSCELCVNRDADTALARRNAEALAGAICRALGIAGSRVKRHWDFNQADPNRHHCPDQMMKENYWPTFVTNVTARIAGKPPVGTTVPPLSYAQPDVPAFMTVAELEKGIDRTLGSSHAYAVRRLWHVLKPTARRQYATLDSLQVGPDLTPGATVFGEFILQNDGEWWVLTRDGSRIRMADLTPQVRIA